MARRYRRPVRRLAACAVLLASLTACRAHTVAIAFRPEVGATFRYEVRVRATTTTTLEGREPDRRDEEVRLIAEHTVLEAGPSGVRVRVLVGEASTVAEEFIVQFNRAAQLESIEAAEGTPAEIIGALGVPEIFPGGAGGPPARRLAPGDEWSVDRLISVPGASEPSRLRVRGRLRELGLAGDEEVARLRSTTELPSSTIAPTAQGFVVLDGHQRIEQSATYDLDDGAVRTVRATTTGQFDIEVQPPFGTIADPVPGTLEVRVTSHTRRLG